MSCMMSHPSGHYGIEMRVAAFDVDMRNAVPVLCKRQTEAYVYLFIQSALYPLLEL